MDAGFIMFIFLFLQDSVLKNLFTHFDYTNCCMQSKEKLHGEKLRMRRKEGRGPGQ